jgi:tetratricopeptide (TPR) repeat protein
MQRSTVGLPFAAAALTLVALLQGCQKSAPSSEQPSAPATASQPANQGKRVSSLRALKLLEGSKFDEAWDECQKVLLNAPDDPRALFVAAQILHHRKKLDPALQTIDRIALKEPEFGRLAHRDAIQWCLQQSRLGEAERRAVEVLAKLPYDTETLKSITAILDLQGRRFEASQWMQRLVRTGSSEITNLILAIDTVKPIESDDLVRARLKDSPNEIRLKSSLAFGALYIKQPEVAEVLFREIVADPEAPAAFHVGLALALIDLEKFDALPQWLNHCPRPEAESLPGYWRALGLWYRHLEMHTEAIDCLTRSVELDPFDFLPLGPLAQSLLALGKTDQAAEAEALFQTMQLTNRNVNYTRDGFRKPEWMLQVAETLAAHGREIEGLAWREWCEQANDKDQAKIAEWEATRRYQMVSSSDVPNVQTRLSWSTRHSPLPDLEWLLANAAKSTSASPNLLSAGTAAGNPRTVIRFMDVAESLGVQIRYDNGDDPAIPGMQTYQSNGAGAGTIDFDRDGWPDLMVLQGGGDPRILSANQPSLLLRNRAGRSFQDVTFASRAINVAYGQGVAVGDWDQDGFADLFVLNFGQNALFRNQGDGSFEQVDAPVLRRAIRSKPVWSVSGAIADINGDHLPDLVEINYASGIDVITHMCLNKEKIPQVCRPTEFPASQDFIYLSDGEGGWKVANEEWGLTLDDGRGLGLIVGNLDGQFGNDIYIANDMSANHLLISSKHPKEENTFWLSEEAVRRGCAVDIQGKPQASMGVACGDIDRNGTLDLFMTNFIDEYNALYLQSPTHFFQDASRRYRLVDPKKKSLGFGTQTIDLDLDGWLDLFVVNGHVDDYRAKGQPYQMQPQVFLQRDGAMMEQNTESYGPFFQRSSLSRSLGMWDYNRDGKVDWYVTHLDQPLSILRNDSTSDGAWLMLECVGVVSERDAIGATITVRCGDETWVHQRLAGNGFECSNEPWIFLGLGKQTLIDSLEIRWPSGERSEFQNIPTNQRYRAIETQEGLQVELLATSAPE